MSLVRVSLPGRDEDREYRVHFFSVGDPIVEQLVRKPRGGLAWRSVPRVTKPYADAVEAARAKQQEQQS